MNKNRIKIKNKKKLDLCESSEDECSNDEVCYLSDSEISRDDVEISEDSDCDTYDSDSEEQSEEEQSDEQLEEEELTLLDFLNDYDVRISKHGFINLRDFVNKVIQSKNPELYIKRVKNKKIIKNKFYIDEDCCLELLNQGKSKKCKEINTKIEDYKNRHDKRSIISAEDKLFQFQGHKFTCFYIKNDDDEWDVWVKGSEVAKFLGYSIPKDAIRDNVESKNKMTFLQIMQSINKQDYQINRIDKQTIFINKEGLCSLVISSKKSKSIDFAKFLNIPIYHKRTYHEIEIFKALDDFFETIDVEYIYQYSVITNNYRYLIDCYLPKYKIAIEIDENGHKDRDPICEITRQSLIEKKLNCKFKNYD
jgi:hypothetical protein